VRHGAGAHAGSVLTPPGEPAHCTQLQAGIGSRGGDDSDDKHWTEGLHDARMGNSDPSWATVKRASEHTLASEPAFDGAGRMVAAGDEDVLGQRWVVWVSVSGHRHSRMACQTRRRLVRRLRRACAPKRWLKTSLLVMRRASRRPAWAVRPLMLLVGTALPHCRTTLFCCVP